MSEDIYLSGTNSDLWDIFAAIRDHAESTAKVVGIAQSGIDRIKEEAI